MLILYIRGNYIQVEGEPYWHHDLWHSIVNILGADGSKVGSVLDPRPGRRRFRWHEAFFSHWGGGIGNPQVLVHGSQNLTGQRHPHPSEFPVLRVYSGVVVLTSHGRKAPAKTEHPQGHAEIGATVGTVPVLRGETTSPWRKPHGPCERALLQVTNIQAGGDPSTNTQASRSALQSSHLRDSHQLWYWSPPAYRRGETVRVAQRGPYSPSSFRSSDHLAGAATGRDRKINDSSLTAHQFTPIFIQSFLLTCGVLF